MYYVLQVDKNEKEMQNYVTLRIFFEEKGFKRYERY